MTEPPASIADRPRPPFPPPHSGEGRNPTSWRAPTPSRDHRIYFRRFLVRTDNAGSPNGSEVGWRRSVCSVQSVALSPSHSILAHPQRMNAEQAVGPGLERRPAAAPGHRLERLDRIFVAVLGMD